MHSRCGWWPEGERMRNSSQQSRRGQRASVEETRPREQGAETHCGVLSAARGDSRQAARGKETAPFPGSSSRSLQRLLYALYWRAAPAEHSVPSGMSACPSESQGAARSRAAFPVWLTISWIKFSGLRSALTASWAGVLAAPAPACPPRAQQLADHSLLPRKAWNSLGPQEA